MTVTQVAHVRKERKKEKKNFNRVCQRNICIFALIQDYEKIVSKVIIWHCSQIAQELYVNYYRLPLLLGISDIT